MQHYNQMTLKRIVMLGSYPPLRALSSYCLALSLSVAESIPVQFISFKKIYPAFLYPGGELHEDSSFPEKDNSNITVRRHLTWYNPFTWISEGLSVEGDLLHAQWWTPFLGLIYFVIFAIFRLRGKPIVITVHNIVPHEKTCIHKVVSQLLFKFSDHYIVHCSSNKKELQEVFSIPDDKVSCIPHGPLDFPAPKDLDRDIARTEFGFSPHHKVILLFGAIRPYKGIDTALTAFVSVLKSVPEARLLIAGKLWEKWDRYKTFIEQTNISGCIIEHLEYIPAGDVARYFLASDLVILPYQRFDSQSGVGAAALAFRKPMIVTDRGGLPDLVVDKTYVVPPNDSVSLAEKITLCLSEPSRLVKMSDDAERISRTFSWEGIAEATLSVYDLVMYKKKSGYKEWDI
jgi:glycosyltransferase involved in cell wall biosynthesis